jgi:hypothetical protein
MFAKKVTGTNAVNDSSRVNRLRLDDAETAPGRTRERHGDVSGRRPVAEATVLLGSVRWFGGQATDQWSAAWAFARGLETLTLRQ